MSETYLLFYGLRKVFTNKIVKKNTVPFSINIRIFSLPPSLPKTSDSVSNEDVVMQTSRPTWFIKATEKEKLASPTSSTLPPNDDADGSVVFILSYLCIKRERETVFNRGVSGTQPDSN